MPSEERKKSGFITNEEQVRKAHLNAYTRVLASKNTYEEIYWWIAVFHQHSGNPYSNDVSAKTAREIMYTFERSHNTKLMSFQDMDRCVIIGTDEETTRTIKTLDALWAKRTGVPPQTHFVIGVPGSEDINLGELQTDLLLNFTFLMRDLIEVCTTDVLLRTLAYLLVRNDLDKFLSTTDDIVFDPIKVLFQEIYALKLEKKFTKKLFVGGTYHQRYKAKHELKALTKNILGIPDE